MAHLLFKTRGMNNPQGKPRVYFCCHQDDFDKYFDEISDEILSKQNCSIWYKDITAVGQNESFFTDLKQMQLFVMPVTSNLLCTENEELDIEFKFAIENHIPVLPLMQEPGLVELFNQKCGELQFLDKNSGESTAISYDEKLGKFLSSVLIGDELAEKIRSAFATYIFLSYRKKDRKQAQDLMRLIHKNELCRDIAIWYDEFLIPGENFNEAIRDALLKSGLFLLAVTPNLINEPNYIMSTEYPMAQKHNKRILPAEIVPTNRLILKEKYNGIPECANGLDETELSLALLTAIDKVTNSESSNSPEQNFYIGLAYLGGVDVEIDLDYAVELIKLSAQSNYEPAQKRLVDMYRNGVGLPINLTEAIKWQAMIVKSKQEQFDSTLSTDDGEIVQCGLSLFDEIIKLGQLLAENKDRQQAVEFFLKADLIIQKIGSHTILPMFLINRSADCLIEIACCEINDKKSTSAIQLLYDAIAKYRECPLDSTIKIGKAYSLIGDAWLNSGEKKRAVDGYVKCIEMLEPLIASSAGNYAAELYLAQAYSQLAIAVDDTTARYTEKAISMYKRIDKEKYSLLVKIDYFWLLVQYADSQRKKGDIENAIRCYCSLFDLAMEIEEQETCDNREDLLEIISVAHYKMFVVSVEREDKEAALLFLDGAETELLKLLKLKPNDECYLKRYNDVKKHFETLLDT